MNIYANTMSPTIYGLTIRLLLAIGISLALTACSSLPTHKPVAPEVTLESVKIASLGLREQTLAFRLNVFNPNDYLLPLDSLDFIASYQDKALAEGSNAQSVDLPPGDTTSVDLLVKTRLNEVLGELLKATANNETLIDVAIKGSLKLDNWPARIPFAVDSSVRNPMLKQ